MQKVDVYIQTTAKSPDTIAMSYMGITNKGKLIILAERVYNNAALDIPIAPSDTVRNYIDFLERNRKEWGGMAKNTFIDNADQATITEFDGYDNDFMDFDNDFMIFETILRGLKRFYSF